MTKAEITRIITALRRGKIYYKPLPYSDVEGGTWISYDPTKDHFVERYINLSIWDRGREDYTKEYTTEQLQEMFGGEHYTDRDYIFYKKAETYQLYDPEDAPKTV